MWYNVTTPKYTWRVLYLISKSIFITRFKQLCKLKKKTQAEIAESLGISVNGLKHYMRKTNNAFPPVEYLDLMAKEFDVDVAYLIGEIDVPKHASLTVANTTGLSTRERDFQNDLKWDDEFDALIHEYYPAYQKKKNKRNINEYSDRTYAIDLITRSSKEYSYKFCLFIDILANSNKIAELVELTYTLLFQSGEDNTVLIKTKDSLKHAYETKVADKKILKNRIILLFDEILTDITDFSGFIDSDTAEIMARQLLEFIEKHYFNIPRPKIKKIISRRLEEIRELDETSIILAYSPEKILGGFLVKLAERYEYKLSSEFLEKYEKELPHSLSYYMNDFQFYKNGKKNYY